MKSENYHEVRKQVYAAAENFRPGCTVPHTVEFAEAWELMEAIRAGVAIGEKMMRKRASLVCDSKARDYFTGMEGLGEPEFRQVEFALGAVNNLRKIIGALEITEEEK